MGVEEKKMKESFCALSIPFLTPVDKVEWPFMSILVHRRYGGRGR
jgi:hypothetical protein